MNRADWYAQRSGGGWRTARYPRRCDRVDQYGLRCACWIDGGARYFDTNQHNPRSRSQWGTIRLCGACALQEIQS
ncbi:hypothetical protein CPT_Mano_039 [Achromobacter phage Mano]|uniref:Uncharacterized protein n=1 Tax=Achromobacter phage Mano TaxID=2767570 RepID=A0A7L8G7G6_9CAUD|nr:hypothetical protein KB680_gp52 [Achromobacter phage Mano]QOE32771.1 hypothetical protein CPT_Mano_039 [Achromobacter phage Mano]